MPRIFFGGAKISQGLHVENLSAMTARPIEPAAVRLLRSFFRLWPVNRGRGFLLNLLARRLRNRKFGFSIDRGLLIDGDLDDYEVVWAFVRDNERDQAFQLSLRLLRPGDSVVDVGANIGLWSLPAAARVGPAGVVHAFEPIPETVERLRRNIAYNGLPSIRCVPAALSDADGRLTLHRPLVRAGRYNSGGAGIQGGPGAGIPVEVRAIRLDTYCSRNGVDRVQFLKADVEGGELLVFQGAKVLLSGDSAPAIMFELNGSATGALGWTAGDVKRCLADYGYRIFRPVGERLVPVPLETDHAHDDLFALKAVHFERLPNSVRP